MMYNISSLIPENDYKLKTNWILHNSKNTIIYDLVYSGFNSRSGQQLAHKFDLWFDLLLMFNAC